MRSFLIPLAAAGLLFGCSQQQMDQAARDADKAGQEIKQDAQQVGREIKQGAEKAGAEAADQLDAGRLKTALMASSKLNSSKINVDREGQTFYLRGSVPDPAQKDLAVRIAKDMAGEKQSVVDELKIAAP